MSHADLKESSGLAPSARHPGLYWTHNDSGRGPNIFLFDPRGGVCRMYTITSRALDWEALSLGPCGRKTGSCLYIGDIGDNDRARKQIQVYRLPEPPIDGEADVPEVLRFRYPSGAYDAEALLVHPRTGDLYIVTKARGIQTETLVFKATAPVRAGAVITLTRVASLNFPQESPMTLLIGRVTGGDIAPDGRRVVLCDYFRGWEYVLPEGETRFDSIWGTTPVALDLGKRRQGEAVCYRPDGRGLVATSEGSPMPVFEVMR